ncbi:MAG TPA: hypothetical protein VKC34_14405, partial [Blastocatellia bacterium]|nr:hypothetical protein [Blastocatellia bacterium]
MLPFACSLLLLGSCRYKDEIKTRDRADGKKIQPSKLGVFRPKESKFYLDNALGRGGAGQEIPFGEPKDIPLTGDWDGNGTVTIGVYRPATNTFYLRNSNMSGDPDVVVPFGSPG